MRRILFSIFLGALIFVADAVFLTEPADARGGFRSSSRGFSSRSTRLRVSRMKSYRFNGKTIRGYRNFVRERRAAKLASGGYKIRSDGSVVHRDFHIRTGRLDGKPLVLRQAAPPQKGVVQGQCRDGATITEGNLDWSCRHVGGIGWSHQSPRIQGVRDY